MKERDAHYPYADGSRYRGKDNVEIFGEIYREKTWNLMHQDSASGEGSNHAQTAQIRKTLPKLLNSLDIQRLLDVPCGDFYWMQQVDLSKIDYTGGDIVPELVRENQAQYESDIRKFTQLDLTHDALPPSDMIFCRDCLVHLSFHDIKAVFTNILQSKVDWVLMTHFPEEPRNKDILTGGWRPLNFCLPPFDLPSPHLLINEGCTEMEGAFLDKSLGCWRTSDLKALPFLDVHFNELVK